MLQLEQHEFYFDSCIQSDHKSAEILFTDIRTSFLLNSNH